MSTKQELATIRSKKVESNAAYGADVVSHDIESLDGIEESPSRRPRIIKDWTSEAKKICTVGKKKKVMKEVVTDLRQINCELSPIQPDPSEYRPPNYTCPTKFGEDVVEICGRPWMFYHDQRTYVRTIDDALTDINPPETSPNWDWWE